MNFKKFSLPDPSNQNFYIVFSQFEGQYRPDAACDFRCRWRSHPARTTGRFHLRTWRQNLCQRVSVPVFPDLWFWLVFFLLQNSVSNLFLFFADSRLNLAQAYAENALFSLTSSYPAITPVDSPRLNAYHSAGRNLLKISDFPRRKTRLHVGKSDIVEFLHKQLPKTEHDLLSFAVDLPIFTVSCGCFLFLFFLISFFFYSRSWFRYAWRECFGKGAWVRRRIGPCATFHVLFSSCPWARDSALLMKHFSLLMWLKNRLR